MCSNRVSDRNLILQLQHGELSALGFLYDRHRQLVYRTALAITGDNEAASDLLQDVFLRLYRFIQNVDPLLPLEPWLYRMTTNLAYTWVKRQRRWLRPLEGFSGWLSGSRNPHQMIETLDTSTQLRKALLKLPLNQRVVVVLYYVGELSVREISEIVDVPIGTVKSRLHYGRQALKRALQKQDQVFSDIDIQYEFT